MHIGLVLSGGMGKGAYQIGALTAIREFLQPSDFEYVSAASIGVLNTYAFLTNNLEKAENIWKTMNLRGDRRLITSVLKSDFLQSAICDIVSAERVSNNFYVPLLSLRNRELSYYNFRDIDPSEILPYLRASVAMPFYNKGIPIGDQTLYDGAVVDNIPIYPVLKNDPDYVICIYFDDLSYVFEDHSLDSKIIKLTFPDDKFISNSINLNPESISYMLEEGYNRTKRILSDIFASGTSALPAIYRKIEEQHASAGNKRMRVTGDVLVTNMNRVAKRLLRNMQILENETIPEDPAANEK